MKQFQDGAFRFVVGIEDTFVPQVRIGERALDEYELTQHYVQWESDLGLARNVGASSIRYGFPWYRLNPAPGVFVWDWADRVVDRLAELDLEVILDLIHYGTPMWLDNGFLNRSYPERVADYAYRLAERYGDRVHAWTPANEPQVNAIRCGEEGAWPPHFRGHDGYVQMIRALGRGIVLSQEAIAAARPEMSFVHVEAMFRYAVDGDHHSDLVDLLDRRRFLALDLVTGRVGADHEMLPYLERYGVTDADLEWFRLHSVRPDVLGINYYPGWTTEVYSRHNGAETHTVRNDWTDGLEDLVHTFAERYGVPIMVTETSVVGTPEERVAWLDASVECLMRLRDEGCPVVGYTWFPFLDLLEWGYREALTPPETHLQPMGLYELVPDSVGILERRPTAAADRYRELAVKYGGPVRDRTHDDRTTR